MNVIVQDRHQTAGPDAAPVTEGQQSADQSQNVELTILMPCLNEAQTIGACIAKAQGYLAR